MLNNFSPLTAEGAIQLLGDQIESFTDYGYSHKDIPENTIFGYQNDHFFKAQIVGIKNGVMSTMTIEIWKKSIFRCMSPDVLWEEGDSNLRVIENSSCYYLVVDGKRLFEEEYCWYRLAGPIEKFYKKLASSFRRRRRRRISSIPKFAF